MDVQRAPSRTGASALARTNPDVPKHKGITYFLVEMSSLRVSISARLGDHRGGVLFNEVFFDDLFVPDEQVVGAVDGGQLPLARTTLANERVAIATGGALDKARRTCWRWSATANSTAPKRIGWASQFHRRAGGRATGSADRLAFMVGGGDPGAVELRKLIGVRWGNT